MTDARPGFGADQLDLTAVHRAKRATVDSHGRTASVAFITHGVATGRKVVVVLARQHFDVCFTGNFAFQLRAAANDVKVAQPVGINALTGDGYRPFFDRQLIGTVVICLHFTGAEGQAVGIDGGCAVYANAVFVGNDDVGLFTENFHRAVNVGRFRTRYFADNGAGFVLQLGIFYRIAANFRYAVLHAVVKDHPLFFNVKFVEFIHGDAFRIRIGNIHHGRAVGRLAHGRAFRLTIIRRGCRIDRGRENAGQRQI